MRRSVPILVALLFVAAVAGGCGKKPTGVEGKAVVVDAQVHPENQQQILTELTGAVHRCWQEKGRRPQTLDEVVAAGFLKSIPTPPPGKRFVIDPRAAQVVLTDL